MENPINCVETIWTKNEDGVRLMILCVFFLWLTNKRKIIETKKGWAVVFYAALSTLTKSFSAAIVELFLSIVTPSDKQNEGHVQGQVSSAAGSGQRPRAHWVPRAPVQRADRHCSICLVRDFAALLLQDDGQVKDPRRTLARGRWERKRRKRKNMKEVAIELKGLLYRHICERQDRDDFL